MPAWTQPAWRRGGQAEQIAHHVLAIEQTCIKRAKGNPGVPTMQEEGYEGFEANTWYGLAGPGKLAPAIVVKVNRDVNAILAMPAVMETMGANGAEDGGGSAERFAQFIGSEQENGSRW